jgi:hypothetical protein
MKSPNTNSKGCGVMLLLVFLIEEQKILKKYVLV